MSFSFSTLADYGQQYNQKVGIWLDSRSFCLSTYLPSQTRFNSAVNVQRAPLVVHIIDDDYLEPVQPRLGQ